MGLEHANDPATRAAPATGTLVGPALVGPALVLVTGSNAKPAA